MRSFLRKRVAGEQAKVDFAELFFDLVFVYAVTQVSHALLNHLTPVGAFQAIIMLLAMWWVWIYTAWATNWLDPTQPLIRLVLFTLMLAGLVFSTSIPEAFEGRGMALACAYVFMQVGRCLFTAWAMRGTPENALNFIRITLWQAFGGIFWIGGAFLDAEQRMLMWSLAIIVEYISPALAFWVPGLGKSKLAELDVEGGHMSERAGLFIIIALGESILVTGATFAESDFSPISIIAFAIAFTGSVAMWWIYFNNTAEHAHPHARTLADADEVARTSAIARNGYTYFHTIIVAGIIVSAVGDELVLAHPLGHHADLPVILTIVGGPMLYLLGTALFRGFLKRHLPVSITVAMAALLLVAAIGQAFDPLIVATLTALVLVALAAWGSLRENPVPVHA